MLACIAFVTLSPIGIRPQIAAPNLERFAAFAVLGLYYFLVWPTLAAGHCSPRLSSQSRWRSNSFNGSYPTDLSAEGLIDPKIPLRP